MLIRLTMDSGREVSRESLSSRDEVLYRALNTVTHSVASRYAVDHQVPGVQHWAVLFKKQLELVRPIDHRWYVRACAPIAEKIDRNTKRGGLNGYVKELLDECRSAITAD